MSAWCGSTCCLSADLQAVSSLLQCYGLDANGPLMVLTGRMEAGGMGNYQQGIFRPTKHVRSMPVLHLDERSMQHE